MPRTSGIYNLPPGYLAVAGEIVQPSNHNPPLEDIAQALTDSLPRDGSASMTANLPMGGNLITGLGDATADGHAVSRGVMNTALGDYLPRAGGTMTGAIVMGGNQITGLGDGSSANHAVRYSQVVLRDGSNSVTGPLTITQGDGLDLALRFGAVNTGLTANSNQFTFFYNGAYIGILDPDVALDDAKTIVRRDTGDARYAQLDKNFNDFAGVARFGTTGNPFNSGETGTMIGSDGAIKAFCPSASCVDIARNSNGSIVRFGNGPVGSSAICGTISVSGASTSYNTSSDYRLKENVAPIDGSADRIASLKPCTFNFTGQSGIHNGFIAHELAEVLPQAVTGEKDAVDEFGAPVFQGVDLAKIVPDLVATVQFLLAEVHRLKSGGA